jgi:peptidoglycan/xylan/chitin deacetylase (PgdA/CDA1 family)
VRSKKPSRADFEPYVRGKDSLWFVKAKADYRIDVRSDTKAPCVTISKQFSVTLGLFALILCSCGILRASHTSSSSKSDGAVSKSKMIRPGEEVVRGPTGKSEIALTFDAGAEAECFEDLITALDAAHVKSTFFITGRFTHDHADCAAEITKHGHEIGNHTWSHLNLTQQPDDVIQDEIIRAERAIVAVSGQNPRPRWRAPYGERNDRVLRIASNLGYRSIYWTIDSLDSVEPKKTPQFLIDRITTKTDAELDGAIILMHVGERSTAEALPAIISNLQARGFHLVTISTLLSREKE